ncbi:MAG TPA: helix-turn-helix transcriptional regulator [Stellaceae bacterium]|nr:helix-turn-helix transcriptional regulator [Stellaceae bacterium]
MSNMVAELERRLEEAEDRNDALLLRLAKIGDALSGGERIPAAIVDRLSEGEAPVRVWREHRALSLRALAQKAGISAALLSEIENGKKEGSVRTLAALARALSVDLDDLIPRP